MRSVVQGVLAGLLLLALVLLLLSSSIFVEEHSRVASRWIFGCVCLFSVALLLIATGKKKPAKLTEVRDGRLAERVASIGAAGNRPIDKLFVADFDGNEQRISVTYWKRNVFVTRRAAEALSEAALDFGVALEVSENPNSMSLPLFGAMAAGVTLTLFVLNGLSAERLKSIPAASVPFIAVGVLLLLLAIIVPAAVWTHRSNLRAQIGAAFRIVANRDAAEEWFDRSIQPLSGEKMTKQLLAQKRICLEIIRAVST